MTRTTHSPDRPLSALLAALLVLGALLPVTGGSAEEGESRRLQQAIEALRRQQAGIRERRDRVSSELAEADRRVGVLARNLRALTQEQSSLEARVQQLQREMEMQRGRIGTLRHELAALVRAAFLAGREERLKLLLNQGDPALVSRMLAYHDYLAGARAARLRELETRLQQLQQLAGEAERKRGELEALSRRLAEERRQLQERKRERQALLARLERELRQGGKRLERMEEDARRLERLVEESGRALQSLQLPEQQEFAERRGRLGWPLAGRLAVAFGAEKIGNLRWDGVIIRAPEGREVKAVHGGRVAYADWLRGYGLLVIIDHGNGYMTLYGHNQSLLKETGDWVREGEVIGLAGRSGGLREPGIYFGIRHEGRPVDPVGWCRRASGRKVG